MSRVHQCIGAAALLCVGASVRPCVVRAQSSPAVRSAVQLAAEGRADSARHLLDAQLNRSRIGDSTWIESLYWRARLAPAGESADRDLRRIVVEYGNSPWADDALLQLAQLALTGGNPAAAMDYGSRLRTDYPGSDLRARAAMWAGRAAFDVGEPRTACALLDSARTEGAGDVEFLNQIAFYRSRCTAAVLAAPATPAARDSSHVDAMSGPVAPVRDSLIEIHRGTAAPPPPRIAGPRFDVQVTAVGTVSAARAVVARLTRAGQRNSRIVSGGRTFRVRLGPFVTRGAADSAALAAKRAVGGKPFVVPLP
jgi:hypothetical protein